MINYAKELEKIIEKIEKDSEREAGTESAKTLLLHSCCAPCSSYVLEYLREFFAITVFYYNPNITEAEEYRKRVEEQKRLIDAYNKQVEDSCLDGMHTTLRAKKIQVIEGNYEPECFYHMAKGLEQCPEGGERCFGCYALRLNETARLAAEQGFDYFTTTLTISPLKNAGKLNEIGKNLEKKYGISFLPSDFKKKNGYKRSIELSEQFGLYRQDYCGCVYSKEEAELRRKSRKIQEEQKHLGKSD